MTEIQTSRNEAYQTVDQQPEAVSQNPIYEHIAWILTLAVVISVTLGFYIHECMQYYCCQ